MVHMAERGQVEDFQSVDEIGVVGIDSVPHSKRSGAFPQDQGRKKKADGKHKKGSQAFTLMRLHMRYIVRKAWKGK